MKTTKKWQTASIVATALNAALCCMWIVPCAVGVSMGVVGIVRSHKAEELIKAGDVEAASLYTNKAKKWTVWSFSVALLSLFFVMAIFVTVALFGFAMLRGR